MQLNTTWDTAKPSRLAAKRFLRAAKDAQTPMAEVEEAMAYLVQQGMRRRSLERRLLRYGFTQQECDTCLDNTYPAFPAPPAP